MNNQTSELDISNMPLVKQAPAKPSSSRQGLREAQPEKSLRDPARAPEGVVRQRKGFIDPFEIPEQIKGRFEAAGWSLEWKRHTVFGQDDHSYASALAENAWEAVTADEIPGFMPKGYAGAIIRDGLMLMKRPAYLTEEARQEDIDAARGLIRAKEAQLGETPPGTFTRDHSTARPQIGRSIEPMAVPAD